MYEHHSKTFNGIRFVLYGFDAINKEKVRSKLLDGGGVDVGRFGPDCTHLIVDKVTYDNPVCVAARNDKIVVVTSLWVDHSYDVAMPVDTTSIVYRPPKDLNGIPGAKSLVVCLTGYQRHDRDDIMTMVGLIGANFSKPLIANKVTHLVCYKFEGEKYELAKKMKKIKLVNHLWLEDCLKAWEILPEADYNKSTYELEMEAEAKDSEEETEDIATKQYGNREVVSPQNSRIQFTGPQQPLVFEQEISRNNINSSGCKLLSDPNNSNQMLSDTRKEKAADPTSCLQRMHSRAPDFPGSCEASALVEASGLPLNPFDENLTPEKVASYMASTSKTAEKSAHSGLSNPSAISYSRKSTRKASLPMYSGRRECNAQSPTTVNKGELNVSDGLNISPSAVVQNETNSGSARTPLSQSLSHREEGPGSKLPSKRKMSEYCHSPKSQKKSPNLETMANKMEGLVASSDNGPLRVVSHLSPLKGTSCMEDNATVDPAPTIPGYVSKTVTPGTRVESNDKALQTSSKELKTSGSELRGVKQKDLQHLDIPSFGSMMTDIQKSSSLVDTDLPKEGSLDAQTKPLKRKMASRKVLGSASKFSKGNSMSKKGSIFPSKTAALNDSAVNSVVGDDYKDVEKSLHSTGEYTNMSRTNEAINIQEPRHEIKDNLRSLDDETEAPEDEGEDGFYVAVHENNRDVIEAPHSVGMPSENELIAPFEAKEDDLHVSVEDNTMKSDKENSKCEAVCGDKNELDESTSLENTAAGRIIKSKKHAATKMKNNLSRATKVASSRGSTQKKGSKSEENNEKTGKDEIPSAAAGKSKKSKTSLEGEKENRPVAGESASNNEEITQKKGSKTEENNEKTGKGKNPSTAAGKSKKSKTSLKVEKEKKPVTGQKTINNEECTTKLTSKSNKRSSVKDLKDTTASLGEHPAKMRDEPACFLLSGHKLQRKEFQKIIKRLKGRVCRDSHQWSYQATHLVVPDPLRRTEKVFAAAASGRWILNTDYLTASNEAGKFLAEQPYEWHKTGLSEDGAINLEAPRRWRLVREKTGHGALYGMRIIVYGECIAPPLDTLKRAVKAGDGIILATSPPYTRFLQSGVDFAIVSPGMPRVDIWVQEFLRHEIPCVLADYLVEYVCKPGYSLDKHVQYGTNAWAEKSLKKLVDRMEEIVDDLTPSEDKGNSDIPCQVCGSCDRGEVMLICGDESGSSGCGVGTHIDCCDPPLEQVPEEDWFCPKCIKTEKKASNRPSSMKGKTKSRKK